MLIFFVSDKKGEKYFSIYACFPCFIHKGGEEFLVYAYYFVLQIGEKEFDVFHACSGMFISVYLHTCLCALLPYLFIYLLCMS